MVNRTLLSNKLAELADRVGQVRRHRKPSLESLRQGAGLRNWIAHGYAGVDLAPVHRAATDGLNDLDAFARALAQWANAHVG
ncbi:MAG: HepT-like ribonuclease domain-containing protein [Deltaproteobacteria bacterium]